MRFEAYLFLPFCGQKRFGVISAGDEFELVEPESCALLSQRHPPAPSQSSLFTVHKNQQEDIAFAKKVIEEKRFALKHFGVGQFQYSKLSEGRYLELVRVR